MNRNIKEDTEDPVVQELFADLITASHILHFHNVLDGYGHVSCRNPYNPSTFFMARDLAPGLVKSRNDLVEYYVDNAEPVLPNAPKGFLERCIHSELLKRFPAMNSVVHSHSPETIPFGITSVPMRACSSLSGFLGTFPVLLSIGVIRVRSCSCSGLIHRHPSPQVRRCRLLHS